MAQAEPGSSQVPETEAAELDNYYSDLDNLVEELEGSYDVIEYMDDEEQDITSAPGALVVLEKELFSGARDLREVTQMLESTRHDFVVPDSEYGRPLPAPKTARVEDMQSAEVLRYGNALYFQQFRQ